MDYKKLLERYKEGIANEEEKQLVEQEIEKYGAIEEYLSEIMEEEFADISIKSGIRRDDEETTKLRKSVNKRLRNVISISVIIVVVLYISVFYVVSGIVDQLYYDPTAVTKSEDRGNQLPDFYYDMQAYTSLNMPGYTNYSFTFQEQKGFGNYELSYSIRDLFTNNENRYFINLSRGKLTSTFEGIFSTQNRFGIWEGFEKIQYPIPEADAASQVLDSEVQRKNEETLRYLNELNPLSYISMKIVFDKDLTMKEFYTMSKEYPTLNFKWLGIRTVKPGTRWSENQPMHLIGFNPNMDDEPSTNQRLDPKKYPFFYINLFEIINNSVLSEEEYTEAIIKAYETHFRSRLEYLSDREEFVDIFDYNLYKTDFYNEALSYIDENGVNAYGGLVFGTAEEFLDNINRIPYDSLFINEVLPVKPNIYYQ